MNQSFANETQIDTFRSNFKNLIVLNLLINYLNLIKESIQKHLLTEQLFFKIAVLKTFAIFRRKHLCCILLFNKVVGL